MRDHLRFAKVIRETEIQPLIVHTCPFPRLFVSREYGGGSVIEVSLWDVLSLRRVQDYSSYLIMQHFWDTMKRGERNSTGETIQRFNLLRG